jgi:elongator complex protein 6
VMQLRTLETGAARDVSGVLRISRGGGWTDEAGDSLDERELLYYIQRDGGLRVFGRGES